ncbi:Hypothetical predicted protein [Mytilus galloprovincialis]|uniref:Uncharacterized protein n=1 Tax=Mytilus galloprovincialis TaxID=29158 RepID=A0A8B6HIL5_MYTGA|nr:Hypothetical predicted protein [Mytilus galloprovincialis]
MSNLIILMDATLDQLQSVEGKDNEMAIQILEKLHNDLVSFRQEIKQDLSIITLQEEDKTMAEVDKTEETTGTSGIRLTAMETSQLIKSTTQFQNHIPLLQDEHREVPEKLDTLIKHKNQQVEEQFGTQPKCLSTPASSTLYQDFSVVSPISKSTSYFMNKDIMGNPCASAENTLKIDTAPTVVKQKHEKPNPEVSVDQGPLAPPMDTPYTGQAQSDTTFTIQTQFNMSTIGQGPSAPPVSLHDADHYITRTHETKLNYLVYPGYPGLRTMVPSSEYYPILV